jgi:hypothetical protein
VAIVTPLAASVVLERVAEDGFLGGLALDSLIAEGDPSVPGELRTRTILLSATEKRTMKEIEGLKASMTKAVSR